MAGHNIIRFGVSIGESLLEKFDSLIGEKGYTNRSEAIRDLIRNSIIESEHDSTIIAGVPARCLIKPG